MEDWWPKPEACHENARNWGRAHPGWTVVPGWIVLSGMGDAVMLAAHSVVKAPQGDMFDVTPFPESDALRSTRKFVMHPGDKALLERFKHEQLTCWCSREQTRTDAR